MDSLSHITKKLEDQSVRITKLQQQIDRLQNSTTTSSGPFSTANIVTIAILLIAILLNSILTTVLSRKNAPIS